MSNKLKREVLLNLYKAYNTRNYPGNTNAELAKGSFISEIKAENGKSEVDLQLVLDSLYSEGYIQKLGNALSTIWSITDKGRNAILTKHFEWHSYDNVLKLIPIIISLLSLIVSIIAICISL